MYKFLQSSVCTVRNFMGFFYVTTASSAKNLPPFVIYGICMCTMRVLSARTNMEQMKNGNSFLWYECRRFFIITTVCVISLFCSIQKHIPLTHKHFIHRRVLGTYTRSWAKMRIAYNFHYKNIYCGDFFFALPGSHMTFHLECHTTTLELYHVWRKNVLLSCSLVIIRRHKTHDRDE